MENPESWDLLTASLAVCNLADSNTTWTFLTRHGLVRDVVGDSATFEGLVQQALNRAPIPGPSVARSIAAALQQAGIALPAGAAPDPWGKMAKQRLQTSQSKTSGA